MNNLNTYDLCANSGAVNMACKISSDMSDQTGHIGNID